MRKGDGMRRAVLVVLFGCAAGAPGRDIPVHREYTRPILFTDERGERMVFEDSAPDLLALQLMRDMKAQEELMGKETLLELSFGSRQSVFQPKAKLSAPVAASAGNESGTRRRPKGDSERNWLVKSLTLPNLGQKSGDAAKTAMSGGDAKSSSWGWLADEVALAQADPVAEILSDAQMPEDDFRPKTPQGMALAGGLSSSQDFRESSRSEEGKAKDSANAASFPVRNEGGQKPSDRTAERAEASARDLSGGTREASSTMQSYRSTASVADMTQTRQMLAELTAGAKSGFVSLEDTLRNNRAIGLGGASEGMAPGRPASQISSFPSGSGIWAGGSGRSSVRSEWTAEGQGAALWRGGWKESDAGESGMSRLGSLRKPQSSVVSPASTRSNPQGGGFDAGSTLGGVF